MSNWYPKPDGVEFKTHRIDCSLGSYTGKAFELETIILNCSMEDAANWTRIRRDFHPHLVIENGWDCKLSLRLGIQNKGSAHNQFLICMWWEPVTQEISLEPFPFTIDEVFLSWVKELVLE